MTTKRCNCCKEEKNVLEFYLVMNKKGTKKAPMSICKICSNIKTAAYRDNNREAYNKYSRERTAQYKYKMSDEEYRAMIARGCDLCGSTERVQMDHDHSCCPTPTTCGKCIRGVLCAKHNKALGMIGDSIESVELLLEYLRKSMV